jgi:4a-hydroxytetrahydrobiopterin dehydratase
MSTPQRQTLDTRLLALAAMRCRPDAPRLGADEIAGHAATLTGWDAGGDRLRKSFAFPSYPDTIAFVNAVAWIAQREDHHPDLIVGYGRCDVTWSTHSAGGVTLNDVICAAKIERLFA